MTAPPLKDGWFTVGGAGVVASGGHVTAPPLKGTIRVCDRQLVVNIGRSRDRPSIEGLVTAL